MKTVSLVKSRNCCLRHIRCILELPKLFFGVLKSYLTQNRLISFPSSYNWTFKLFHFWTHYMKFCLEVHLRYFGALRINIFRAKIFNSWRNLPMLFTFTIFNAKSPISLEMCNYSQTFRSFVRYQALEYLNITKKHPLIARYSARMLWGFRLPPNVFKFSDQIVKLCNFGNFRAKLWFYLLCLHHISIFVSPPTKMWLHRARYQT